MNKISEQPFITVKNKKTETSKWFQLTDEG